METGGLRPLRLTTGIRNPFFMVVSRDRRFLYAIDAETFGGAKDEAVSAFAIDGTDGGLRFLNRQSTQGTASCYMEPDPAGKAVVVANYTTGNVAALPLNWDGSLRVAVSVSLHSGSSIHPERQKQPHAHCCVVSPDGRWLLVANMPGDNVTVFAIDPDEEKLIPSGRSVQFSKPSCLGWLG